MNLTIQMVLVATVGAVVAGIAVFMVTGEAGDFSDFVGGQSESAQCSLYQSQWPEDDEEGAGEKQDELTDKMDELDDCDPPD